MKTNKIISNFMLALTAAIWGVAFVAQSKGMEYIEPFTFNAVRNIIGGIVLIPCILLMNKLKGKEIADNQTCDNSTDRCNNDYKNDKKILITGGILCGIFLFLGSTFQQFGIVYTTPGKSGFITALYIVLVPVLGIFVRKRIPMRVWISVIIAIAGFYLLCINEGLSVNKGDLLTLVCAVFFALHILVVDYFSPKTDGVKMSCIQFFVCGIISIIFMFICEKPVMSQILAAWLPILYAGVLSCGVAYTLQIIAQKNTDPVTASLLMSLESVFAVLAGWVILKQTLSIKELAGCLFVFSAILITQLPDKTVENAQK